MLAKYATIVRRASAVTTVAAVLMVILCAVLGGSKGLIGSLLGVALVTVFFGISVVVVGRAARVSPQAMMLAAIISYLVKIVTLAIVLSAIRSTTVFNTRDFGLTALVCILVWSAAQVVATIKTKMLYVEPEQHAVEPEQHAVRRGK